DLPFDGCIRYRDEMPRLLMRAAWCGPRCANAVLDDLSRNRPVCKMTYRPASVKELVELRGPIGHGRRRQLLIGGQRGKHRTLHRPLLVETRLSVRYLRARQTHSALSVQLRVSSAIQFTSQLLPPSAE